MARARALALPRSLVIYCRKKNTRKLPNSELYLNNPPYAHTQTHYKNEYLSPIVCRVYREYYIPSENLDNWDSSTCTSTNTEAASPTYSCLFSLLEPHDLQVNMIKPMTQRRGHAVPPPPPDPRDLQAHTTIG